MDLRNVLWSLKVQKAAMEEELTKSAEKLVTKQELDDLTVQLAAMEDCKKELSSVVKKLQVQKMMLGALCFCSCRCFVHLHWLNLRFRSML